MRDREIRSRSHPNPQLCTQVSYRQITNRRGDGLATQVGFDINAYVPFYFSPATSMAYTISQGNVPVRSATGEDMGKSRMSDMVFIVTDPRVVADETAIKLSSRALNKLPLPEISDNIAALDTLVKWSLFDEFPRMGRIPEIDYQGVGKYFRSTDEPGRELRSEHRSAEFLVYRSYPMRLTNCIVTQNQDVRRELSTHMQESELDIPLLTKPSCFYS